MYDFVQVAKFFHSFSIFSNSEPNFSYIFFLDEPLIASVITNIVLYGRYSVFSDEWSNWSYTVCPYSRWGLASYLYIIKKGERDNITLDFRNRLMFLVTCFTSFIDMSNFFSSKNKLRYVWAGSLFMEKLSKKTIGWLLTVFLREKITAWVFLETYN